MTAPPAPGADGPGREVRPVPVAPQSGLGVDCLPEPVPVAPQSALGLDCLPEPVPIAVLPAGWSR